MTVRFFTYFSPYPFLLAHSRSPCVWVCVNLPEMEDEDTHRLPAGGSDELHRTIGGDEGSASTSGAKTSTTAPDPLNSNGAADMTKAPVEASASTSGASVGTSGTADAGNIPRNSVSDYVDALTTLALMPRAVRVC